MPQVIANGSAYSSDSKGNVFFADGVTLALNPMNILQKITRLDDRVRRECWQARAGSVCENLRIRHPAHQCARSCAAVKRLAFSQPQSIDSHTVPPFDAFKTK